jgi:hypothetical protein
MFIMSTSVLNVTIMKQIGRMEHMQKEKHTSFQ